MRGAEEFGPDFQRQLVRAMLDDPGLKALVSRFIKAAQLGWTDPASLWGWQVIGEDDAPSMLKLKTELRRLDSEDPARIGATAIVEATADVRDSEYVRQSIVEWARRQTFMLGFSEARDKIDRAMGGGLSPGELEVVMAYSGIGKTFWCVQRGFTAARRRQRCLHFVLEGGRSKTEDRYEARFAETLYHDVKGGNISASIMAAMQREYRLLKQNLVIRGFGDLDSWRATYDDLLAELKELRATHGWVPAVVVVDYGDLLWAGAEGESEYMRQKVAFRQLKALSERIEFRGHRGYAVCSPTQAQRPDKGADKREHVLRPRDVADCYEKVRVSDVIISLNRTEREKEYELARVYLGKYRDAEDGCCVRVRTAYTRGGFSDLSVREEPPPPPPEDK